jgi:hypothetical protein
MKDGALSGSFLDTPFPRILFRLWQGDASGCLRLRRDGAEKTLTFEQGRLVIDKASFQAGDFLKALVKKRVLPAEDAQRCRDHASASGVSLVRALSELGLVSPLPLWNLMESFFVRSLFSLFEWEEGRFAFEAGAAVPAGERYGLLETQDFILQGVRQIQSAALLERHLPEDTESLYVSAPYFLHHLNFEPHERYVLHLLSQSPTLKGVYERSELGTTASRRVLFVLSCLDILTAAGRAPKNRAAADAAPSGFEKVLEALNDKCAHIHKYIAKQIGPLAHTILGNCLEEIRPGLGPLFQKMKLLPDGKIEVDSALHSTASHLSEEIIKALRDGYDDILMAEILAVKKALGASHESALVKALEKVGCL